LHEAEDVIDEEQHVFVFFVKEMLGDRQSREPDARARARRLIHLAIDQGGFVDDARLFHLEPQIVALTGSLAHTTKDRVAAVLRSDIVDQFLEDNGLAHTSATEQAHFPAQRVRSEQVDNLNAGLQDFRFSRLVNEGRSCPMNGGAFDMGQRRTLIHRLTHDVEDPAQGLFSDRHGDPGAGVAHWYATDQAFSAIHSDTADGVLTQMLGDFEDQVPLLVVDRAIGDLKGVVNGRERAVLELDVYYGSHHLRDLSDVHIRSLLAFECLTGRDNLQQFSRDARRTGTVHVQGQTVDHVYRFVGRVIHGGHACAVLAGNRFKHGPIDEHVDIAGEQTF